MKISDLNSGFLIDRYILKDKESKLESSGSLPRPAKPWYDKVHDELNDKLKPFTDLTEDTSAQLIQDFSSRTHHRQGIVRDLIERLSDLPED